MSGKYVRVDDVMELINTSNRGTCDYFIVDQIEELCRSEKIYDLDKVVAELEDLEEQGRLLRLPCSIGVDVYMIPSKTNYLLNIFGHREKLNKIYHQNVERITFTKRGWYMECDKDAEYGTGKILVDTSYGVTWFLSHEEAEAKLKEIEESL